MFMKKSIIIVDLLLLVIFGVLVLSKLTKIATPALLQLSFMIFIGIHILQHWRIIVAFIKQIKK